jgi:hypothetical protein
MLVVLCPYGGVRIARGVLLLALPLLGTASCTADKPDPTASSASETTSAGPTETGLPGDEALSPPPPDPAGPDLVAQLSRLPVGGLSGTVDLAVSGLTAFAEPVQGRCTQTADGRGFEIGLSDGSVLEVGFGPDGGVSRLTAPGIAMEQTLSDVDLQVDGGFRFSAGLLTGGTTEPSGHLTLSGVCA